MIQDPSGLLQRITELEPLCSDPGIKRAVEGGDPFKVYRAILRAWLFRRLPRHRATLKLLIDNRRAFARPLTGNPMLGTFNSFGATLLGSAEAEPDGTRIATHYVVVLFALPLFPLGAYLVSGGERSGLSTSWQVFARVPLAAGTWLWSRALALSLALAVAWAGLGAIHTARHHDLHVVNGLGLPLQVTIGETALAIGPGQHKVVNLRVGSHAARASAGGKVLEPAQVDVNVGGETLVWNVAGAAPVLETLVKYTSGPARKDEAPEQQVHCGAEIIRLAHVDDAFVRPPEQVSMGKSVSVLTRRNLMVADTGTAAGWQVCVRYLLSRGKAAESLRLLERRGRLERWTPEEASMAVGVAMTISPAEGERTARLALAALPDDTLVHRSVQNALMAAGKEAEVLAEARRRAEAAPGSAQAQYLLARLLRGEEQVALVEALAARFPADGDVLRLATAIRAETGAWKEADATWRALAAISMPQAAEVLREEATALLALGRGAEALRVLERAFEALGPGEAAEAAVLYALVATRTRAPEPDALLKRLEKDGPARWLRVRAGLPDPVQPTDRFLGLLATVRRDPGAALQAARGLGAGELLGLDPDVWGLLWGEAVRTGAREVADLLTPRGYATPAERAELERFVRGEPVPMPHGSQQVVRAAAAFIRSRNPSLPASERARLLAQARREDHLGTAVTHASSAWPAPAAAP
jgi:tetratricopeptide (TPR) repeat protein